MEDGAIVALYWRRDEAAVEESRRAYGAYCRAVALNILGSLPDAEECENDAYLAAWQAIPPERPRSLRAWLGRVTRNIALDRWEAGRAAKRGGGETALALEELADCVASTESVEDSFDAAELSRAINSWLRKLGTEKRRLFLRRYWLCESVSAAAEACGMGEGRAKTMLHRLRLELRRHLEKEGLL